MKKLTVIAMAVGCFCQFAQAQSLEQAVAQTLTTNPKIKEAYALYLARQYNVDEARGGYFPKLDAIAGVGPERIKSANSSDHTSLTRKDLTLSLSQMLFDGFDTSNNVDRTTADSKAKRLALLAMAEDTSLRTVEVYIGVLKQQEIFDLAQNNLATHEQILNDITKRTTSGVGSTADLSQIQGRVAQAYANVAAAQNNLDDAKAQFLRVVNSTPESLVEPVADAKMVPTSLDEALKKATKDNPTLLSSLQDIEAAKYQHEGAKANNYPKLSIEAGQTWYDDADGIEGNRDEMSAMLRVRYNLFNGGSDSARMDSTAALYSQAKEIHDNAYREVEEGTRLAWQARESLKKQKEFLQQHVESSYQTVSAYKQQFTLGQRTLLDVLNTENELFEARKNYVSANYDELFAQYRLLNADGKLLDSLRVARPAEWKEKE